MSKNKKKKKLFFQKHRKQILPRIVVYCVILIIAFSILFVKKDQIYNRFIERNDITKFYLNPNGIPILDYGYKDGIYIGPQISPLWVAWAVEDYYDQILQGNTSAKTYFNNTINWLIENSISYNINYNNSNVDIIHWYYNFSIWGLPSGFYSSMAEAEILRALTIAFKHTNNQTYLDYSHLIINTFEVPKEFGGNLHFVENNLHWYPEYLIPKSIDPSYTPRLVLNGFLFALEDFYYTNLILNETRLNNLFNEGISTATKVLYKYNIENEWTYYQLNPLMYTTEHYHQVHINLMQSLHNLTNLIIFYEYYVKWMGYTNYPKPSIIELINWRWFLYGGLAFFIISAIITSVDTLQFYIRKFIRKRRDKDINVQ